MIKRTLRLSTILLLAAIVVILQVIGIGAEQPYFRRKLSSEKIEEIRELKKKLQKPNLSVENQASIIRQLACFRHEMILPIIGEVLKNTKSSYIRTEIATDLGLIGSPLAIPLLIYTFKATGSEPDLKLSGICAISEICKNGLESKKKKLITEISQYRGSLEEISRDFFKNFIRNQKSYIDGIPAWANILKAINGDPVTEMLIIELLQSNQVGNASKHKLFSLFLTVPVAKKRKLKEISLEAYQGNSDVRFRMTILGVLSTIKEGKNLILNVSHRSKNVLLRRCAIDSLSTFIDELSVKELTPVLKETDVRALRLLESLTVSWLNERNISPFVKHALSNWNVSISKNSCRFLRASVKQWKKEKLQALWLKATSDATPVLLKIMSTEPSELESHRRTAFLTLKELYPPNCVMFEGYDPAAPYTARKGQISEIVQSIQNASKNSRITNSIERACQKPDIAERNTTPSPTASSRPVVSSLPATNQPLPSPTVTALPPSATPSPTVVPATPATGTRQPSQTPTRPDITPRPSPSAVPTYTPRRSVTPTTKEPRTPRPTPTQTDDHHHH